MNRLGGGTFLRVAMVASLLDPVVDLDGRIQRAVQAARPTAFEGLMHAATDVGRHEVVLGGLLAVALFTGPGGPATAREALLALIPANLVVEATKRLVGRARPDERPNGHNSSFPSGHAASAFALALVFARRWRKLAPAFFAAAVLVACSRIYLNRHFASDVLCGAIVGVVCAWVAGRVISRRPKVKEITTEA